MKLKADKARLVLEIVQDFLVNIDSDRDGIISTEELADGMLRVLQRVKLPWYARLVVNRKLLTLILDRIFKMLPSREAVEVLKEKKVSPLPKSTPELAKEAFAPAPVQVNEASPAPSRSERVASELAANEKRLQELRQPGQNEFLEQARQANERYLQALRQARIAAAKDPEVS